MTAGGIRQPRFIGVLFASKPVPGPTYGWKRTGSTIAGSPCLAVPGSLPRISGRGPGSWRATSEPRDGPLSRPHCATVPRRINGFINTRAVLGICADNPHMQRFARKLFLSARQCGAAGMALESHELFDLALRGVSTTTGGVASIFASIAPPPWDLVGRSWVACPAGRIVGGLPQLNLDAGPRKQENFHNDADRLRRAERF